MTGVGSSCGACKFLRRKCSSDCVFAPYFSYEQAASHFSAVHKVFGASNASKLLSHLPVHSRNDAAVTISYEALARMHDPIYGCVAHIFALQQQVASLKEEIESIGNQIVNNLGIIDTTSSSSCTVMSKETACSPVFVHQQQGGSYIPTQYGNAYASSVNDSAFSLQNLGLTDDESLSQAYFDPTTLAALLEEIS